MKKLLIIDDEEFFCRAMKKSLEAKMDFEVLTATRGDEGMRLAKAENPDIILLDMMMPGMYGTEVARALSEDPATRSIPIIFITAMINEDDIKRGAGISSGKALIAKPVKLDELIEKIHAVLSA
ncbi:MAG TPA: response regulator [Smithellaceae bacterium]|nr:response regulator [Smithellaceae bacterium]